mgnify:CR=1 FL=1
MSFSSEQRKEEIHFAKQLRSISRDSNSFSLSGEEASLLSPVMDHLFAHDEYELQPGNILFQKFKIKAAVNCAQRGKCVGCVHTSPEELLAWMYSRSSDTHKSRHIKINGIDSAKVGLSVFFLSAPPYYTSFSRPPREFWVVDRVSIIPIDIASPLLEYLFPLKSLTPPPNTFANQTPSTFLSAVPKCSRLQYFGPQLYQLCMSQDAFPLICKGILNSCHLAAS